MAVSKKRNTKKKVQHCNYNVTGSKNVDTIKSNEYKTALYLGIGSLVGAYLYSIVGLIVGIFGLRKAIKATKENNEGKLPLILNIVGTSASALMMILLIITPIAK